MTQTAYHGGSAKVARAVCVFAHGRGQTPNDMVDTILSRLAVPDVRFVLPRAPRPAWYDAKAVDPLTDQTRAQLDEALEVLADAVTQARAELPGLPLIVGGFSQGACLATEYLMRGGAADAAVLLTGCRVGAAGDALPVADLSGLPVYAANSDADPWIPLPDWHRAVADLAGAGARLRCDVVPGRGHEASDTECLAFADLLSSVCSGHQPWEIAA